MSLNILIQLLERVLGVESTVIYAEAKSGDVRHSLADIALARRILGYSPKIMVEEGLRSTVEAMENRRS
jgi:UDP-glucose 4-epimerase